MIQRIPVSWGAFFARASLPLLFVCLTLLLAACDNGAEDTGTDHSLVRQGREVFERCQACHVVAGEQNKVGPHLVGLFGRPAGSVEGFRYSEALRDSGIVWDEESLKPYLRDPRRAIPGNRMAFPGIRDEEDLTALIRYLETATAAEAGQ